MGESGEEKTGAPCWVELMAPEGPPATSFYSELFGWQVRPLSAKFERYLVFYNEERPIGACNQYGPAEAAGWCVFFSTDDAGRSLQQAQYAGGRLLSPAVAVGDLGTTALVEDPAGASVGLWQAGAFAGFAGGSRPGDPIWYELQSSDWGGAATFYGLVFGLKARATGRVAAGQAQLLAGDRTVAGLHNPGGAGPPGPARWQPQFAVADLRGAMEKVIRLGGSFAGPVTASRAGYRVTVEDPGGARFELGSLERGRSRSGPRR